MKKILRFISIILVILVGIVILDTFQANILNNSPILRIREDYNGGNTYYIDKGILVDHYYCSNKKEKTVWKKTKYTCLKEKVESTEEQNERVLQCLEKELEGYLVNEQDDLIEIPLSEITSVKEEQFDYYKGVYASNHPENRYVIVYPKNGTYDFDIMKDFDKYFYKKFPIYQKSNSTSMTMYVHNKSVDVDLNSIINKCETRKNTEEGKKIPSKGINQLKKTKKIVIKSSQKELGTITSKEKISEILNSISNSKQYGDVFLCDSTNLHFKMYDSHNKLIDTIYIWADGKRILPASLEKGCSYYTLSNNTDLRNVIEEETDYIFYNILDFRDTESKSKSLIYKDANYSYYLNSEDTDEILIQFMTTDQTMSLKYALENNYILARKVAENYPDILIKK